jgi:hypothetical protein
LQTADFQQFTKRAQKWQFCQDFSSKNSRGVIHVGEAAFLLFIAPLARRPSHAFGLFEGDFLHMPFLAAFFQTWAGNGPVVSIGP